MVCSRVLQCGQFNLHDLVLYHRVQLEEAGGGVRDPHVRVLHVQILHVQVGKRRCDRGHGWRWVVSLLSTVVTDVIGFVTLLFALELLDEVVELCVGEGARRGLRVLQVACWTPSLVAKCLSISVFGKATDVSKGQLTRDQVFVGFDLSHESHHL